MQWTDEVQIETPEQLDLGLEVAGLGSRFYAKVVDWVIKFKLMALTGLAFLIFTSSGGDTGLVPAEPGAVGLLLGILIFAFFMGYDIFFEIRFNGRTFGKWWAGIRVVRESGAPVDFRSVCIRNLLSLVDALPMLYLLGCVIVQLSARSQRLGDMAAGTIVVRERQVEAPEKEIIRLGFLVSDEFQFTADQLRNCTPNDRHILRSFFRRYQEMNEEARHQLACRLAEQFLEKIPYQPDPPIWPYPRAERFLASIYRDLTAHLPPSV
jgi:uncharacterized RDD family membrane protein YckC